MKMTHDEMIQWLHDYAEGPMAHNPEHADVCNTLTAIRVELERLQAIVDRLPKSIVDKLSKQDTMLVCQNESTSPASVSDDS